MTPELEAYHIARLAQAGTALRAARQREAETLTAARNAALAMDSDGMSERKIGRQLGVNRKTVRKWLGKQTY